MSLRCIVVTPEKTELDCEANAINLPMFDGALGVLPGRAPMIGRLGYGELRITSSNNNVERYYIDGGFAQVADNVVTLLTSRVVPAADVDGAAAREQLKNAMNRPAHTPELLQVRDRNVQQARAQIRLAEKS